MGLFDTLSGMAASALSQSSDPRAQMLQSVINVIQHHDGGLAGVLQQLQQGGLGNAVSSWIGSGQNQPVSADAIGSAIGPDKLAGIAAKLGVSPEDLSAHLSQMLPQVVDHLTPGGQVEAGGFDLSKLGGLLGGLAK